MFRLTAEIILLLFILEVFVIILRTKKSNNRSKGQAGEDLTEQELIKLNHEPNEYHGAILCNLYLPTNNGNTTEIDILYITPKGIYVIENKNYSGWIFGTESNRFWTVTYPGGHKEKLFNPIWQNKGHIKALANILTDDIPLYSVIVFNNSAEIKKMNVAGKSTYVIYQTQLTSLVKQIWDATADIAYIKEENILNVYDQLVVYANVSEETKKKHIDQIRKEKEKL